MVVVFVNQGLHSVDTSLSMFIALGVVRAGHDMLNLPAAPAFRQTGEKKIEGHHPYTEQRGHRRRKTSDAGAQ